MLESVEYVWFAVAIAVMVGMAWLGFRIEPHHVGREGRKILCMGQLLTAHGEPVTRWRETKLLVLGNGRVQAEQRRFLRRRSALWRVTAESDDPPRKRAVFLLRAHDAHAGGDLLAVKMPATSRAVEILRSEIG